MAPPTRSIKHLLQWLVAGTRGGENRGRIIDTIREEPMNTNQLRIELGLDYRTVKHHLDVLEDNGLVTTIGDGYGQMYIVSASLDENIELFDEIWDVKKKKMEEDKN
jgi:DNA-binding transcriptional ArsR family regulator